MPIEITEWLRELGLEQYAPAFRDNAIDHRILPKLTAEDLKDLGVTLVGHRRQLLAPSRCSMPKCRPQSRRRPETQRHWPMPNADS